MEAGGIQALHLLLNVRRWPRSDNANSLYLKGFQRSAELAKVICLQDTSNILIIVNEKG